MIKDFPDKNQDKLLPKAETCFFNFSLPHYSSREIMKKMLLIAITYDNVSMNAENHGDEEDGRGPPGRPPRGGLFGRER
jgi:hypothetical protein